MKTAKDKPALMTLHFSICVEFALEGKQEGDWRDLKMPWFDMALDRHYKDYELGILLKEVVTMARKLAFREAVLAETPRSPKQDALL